MPPNLPKTVCPSPTTEGNGTEDEALRLLTEYADDGDEAPRGDSEDAGAKVRNFLQELSDTGLLDSKGDNGNMTDEGTKEATGSDAGSGGETVAGDDAPAAPVPHADTKSDEPLPDGWEELFDPNYKATYYFCRVSGVVQWTRPDHTTSAAQAPGRPCPAATPEADATTTPAGLGQVPTSSVSAGSGAASMKESATVAEAVNAGGVEAHLRSMMESCNTCMSELDARVLSLTPYIGNADIAQGCAAAGRAAAKLQAAFGLCTALLTPLDSEADVSALSESHVLNRALYYMKALRDEGRSCLESLKALGSSITFAATQPLAYVPGSLGYEPAYYYSAVAPHSTEVHVHVSEHQATDKAADSKGPLPAPAVDAQAQAPAVQAQAPPLPEEEIPPPPPDPIDPGAKERAHVIQAPPSVKIGSNNFLSMEAVGDGVAPKKDAANPALVRKGKGRPVDKKASAMIDKWKQKSEEIHGPHSPTGDVLDPELAVKAHKRQREDAVEAWRLDQLRSGNTSKNSNFQPLLGDWRERVKKAKQQEARLAQEPPTNARDGAGAATVDSSHPVQPPDLSPYQVDLPEGWHAMWDAASGDVYYGNITTRETSWEKPVAQKKAEGWRQRVAMRKSAS
mmetsp:Transcript_8244/g.30403  ORF Transcript_8244/g.30403 Transcript_8244/m.30403 type:complete len:623 (+) Transcript_8244:38-1906(+)